MHSSSFFRCTIIFSPELYYFDDRPYPWNVFYFVFLIKNDRFPYTMKISLSGFWIDHQKSVEMTDIGKSRIRSLIKVEYFLSILKVLDLKLGHRISTVLILNIISTILWKWRKNLKGSTLKIKNLKDFLKKSYKICPTAKSDCAQCDDEPEML